MRHRWRAKKRAYGRWRAYRKLTPYEGYAGHGRWLTHLAIPRYIVDCESHGSWGAANPSGAVGPYQLLGWGAPYPATTWHEKMANHRIARSLWLSQGSSPWVCA